jgi:hypothetical protein
MGPAIERSYDILLGPTSDEYVYVSWFIVKTLNPIKQW